MKYILLFIFFFPIIIFAQEREISNTITDEKGEGIPGVSISIKGRNIGTSTDADGRYTIKVKKGDILVIQSLGMKTREFLVTETGLRAIQGSGQHITLSPKTSENTNKYLHKLNPKDSIVFDYEIFMGKDTISSYKNAVDFEKEAKKLEIKNEKSYLNILQPPQNIKAKKNKIIFSSFPTRDYFKNFDYWHINYVTSFSFFEANKFPKLQNQFVQGRPLNGQNSWLKDDIFSWGENIKNLEYNNNNALVGIGLGNGTQAKSFNPFNFFGTGYSFKNELTISKRWKYWTFKTSLLHQNQQNIIPKQTNNQTDIQALITHSRKQTFQINIIYNNIQQRLPNIGANWQSIMGNVYRTPISFDNQNNTNISHSPQTDNPYFYTNIVPDKSLENNFAIGISQKDILLKRINTRRYEDNKYLLGYFLNYKINQRQTNFGLLPAMAGSSNGRYTERKTTHNTLNGNVFIDYDYYHQYNSFLKRFIGKLSYDYSYQNTNLARQDAQNFATNASLNFNNATFIQNTNVQLDRHTHELLFDFDLKELDIRYEDLLQVKTGFRTYFSSTLTPKNYQYFLPHFVSTLDIKNLLRSIDDIFDSDIFDGWRNYRNMLLFNIIYGNSVQETPLLYNQFQFNSLQTLSENYGQYFENKELYWQNGLTPEKNRKLDLSLSFKKYLNYNNHYIRIHLTRFIHQKNDMIVPVFENNNFSLQNGIHVRNTGWEMLFEFHTSFGEERNNYSRQPNKFISTFTISRYNPIVTHLSNGRERIALAGYKDISTQAIVGQPLGVIVGTQYLRNENGQKIIDGQGFPMVNSTPQILGNPNPNFIMTWLNEIKFQDFTFSILLEYRKGGQVWNGTKNALNYLGRSQQSADERHITNFVFEGVNLSGQPNQIPIDFANPLNGLSGNRFVRYGFAGVGEEAIESATSFRLREVIFSHNFTKHWKKIFPKSEATFMLYAQNLLLYTPYSGVDPETMLMNYQGVNGLDLFNVPAMRTFGGKLLFAF